MSGGIGPFAGTARPLSSTRMQLVDVVAHADRAAQRDLLRRVAADDRVLHVEIRPPGVRPQQHVVDDALRRELGRSLPLSSACSMNCERKDVEKVELRD